MMDNFRLKYLLGGAEGGFSQHRDWDILSTVRPIIL